MTQGRRARTRRRAGKAGGKEGPADRLHDPERLAALREAIHAGRYDTLRKMDAVIDTFLGPDEPDE